MYRGYLSQLFFDLAFVSPKSPSPSGAIALALGGQKPYSHSPSISPSIRRAKAL